MNIGYIGLGALGGALARRFLSGRALTVLDLNPTAVASLQQLGAATTPTAAELARRSDVILLCLPRSDDVRRAIFGQDGVAEGLTAGKIVIDQTSGIPAETREMAAKLAERDVVMIDASVSAGPQLVTQGGATLMVGGPEESYAAASPVLQAITETVYHCGSRVGDGQAMKMVNNAMNAGCRLGTLELAAMGRKLGLSLKSMSEFLNQGPGGNQTTARMLPALVEGKASTDFALSLMLKDVNQAVSLGMDLGVPMPISGTVRSLLQLGLNTLGDRARLEDMVGLIESMAATRLAQPPDEAVVAHSLDEHRLVKVIDNAVASLGAMVTYECTALGLRYGLTIESMARVLVKASGWSVALRRILPGLAAGQSVANTSLREIADALKLAGQLGIRCGAPTMILNDVRSFYEAGANELGDDADGDDIMHLFEVMAGVKFSPHRADRREGMT